MAASLTILLVEDHDALRAVTAEVLRTQGHAVTEAPSAEALDEVLPRRCFDVAVLDLNLPGENGFSLSARLRKTCPGIGIVMVTVRQALQDKMSGYDHGADVYLTKPTEPQELCAVVQALGRRLNTSQERADTPGEWLLDLTKGALSLGQNSVQLRQPEARVLQALALAPQAFLEHWQLLQILGKPVDDQGKAQLEVLISRLRRKLQELDAGVQAIRADRGRGYGLAVPVTLV